jgi:hypothetical protein
MNLRLNILRLFASLTLLLGVGVILMGIALGFSEGGLAWLPAVVIISLGCLFIAGIIRFLRKPSLAVATEVLAVLSFLIFGSLTKYLEKAFPDFGGIPKQLGMPESNALLMHGLVSLLITWVIYRVLKKLLLDGAFPPATPVKAEAADRR